MTLQEALEVTLPSGKRLGSATLFDIYEFGSFLASMMVDPAKLERAGDDNPIWKKRQPTQSFSISTAKRWKPCKFFIAMTTASRPGCCNEQPRDHVFPSEGSSSKRHA